MPNETMTMEQQFAITSFKMQIQGLNKEQALDLLADLYSQMIRQDAAYKSLLKQVWGLE